MAFVSAKLTPDNGYVYEHDAAGGLTAIVFTGTITDDAWGDWVGAFRLEGAELAAMPAEAPGTAGTSSDPRYHAIMAWLGARVKAKHDEMTAIQSAVPVITARPATEVSQLPAITPALLAQLAPSGSGT